MNDLTLRDLLDLTESVLIEEVPLEHRGEFRKQLRPPTPQEERRAEIAEVLAATGARMIVVDGGA